jgi:hypothetical protein
MKIKLPNWIDQISGYNNGIVFYGYKDRFHVQYARDYVMPTLTVNNATFGTENKAIIGQAWMLADASFKADMQLYADAWDETQQSGREASRKLTALNLFIKACFAAGEKASFDLSTLTTENFGGTVGDLLGTNQPNVGELITFAEMPSCNLDLTALDNPIIAA